MPWTETLPTALAVNLEDLKDHLRVTSAEEDALVRMYAQAAAQLFEAKTRRRLINRTAVLYLEDFPMDCDDLGVELPFAPVSAISSVQYYDTAGVLTTWDSSNYLLDAARILPRLVLAPTKTFPVVQDGRPDGVQITFTAGYGASYSSIPDGVRFAVFLLAAHFFRNRSPVTGVSMAEVPLTLQFAIDAYKIWSA